MTPNEIKRLAKRLRQAALPDPHDEREVMHAPLMSEAAAFLESLSEPSGEGIPDEPWRWHWVGNLRRYVNGRFSGEIEHNQYRSDLSLPVVLAAHYDALRAAALALQERVRELEKLREADAACYSGESIRASMLFDENNDMRDKLTRAEAALAERDKRVAELERRLRCALDIARERSHDPQ